jgi:2-desacetyl-2-hydroxyethyl bacteriochlorophyllide A dehydrogenase
VLVRVEAVGICGSDVVRFDGHVPTVLPLILGHEFAGTIVDVHPSVEGWSEGDRVAVSLLWSCGRCLYCRNGREPLCTGLKEIGIHVDGAFAEFVAVPETSLHRLPDALSFEEGASVDPVASAYRGVVKAGVATAEVLIAGPGPIGLYALQIAKAMGARRVVVSGTKARRLELAERLGADATIDVSVESLRGGLRRFLTDGQAGVIIEATGQASVLPDLLDICSPGGRIVLLGVFYTPVTLPEPETIVRRELEVVGSLAYTQNEFRASLRLVADRHVQVLPLITHRLGLEQMDDALGLLKRREAVKVMLFPHRAGAP